MFVGEILFCSLRKFMKSTQTTYSSTTILVLDILDYTSTSCSLLFIRFDKVTRHGGLIGKRTVAGRVVKESYGASKQQHTFTVRLLSAQGIIFSHMVIHIGCGFFASYVVIWSICLHLIFTAMLM